MAAVTPRLSLEMNMADKIHNNYIPTLRAQLGEIKLSTKRYLAQYTP